MGYSENSNINQAAYELLTGVEINEAFHEKDRTAVKEIDNKQRHHSDMIGRHMSSMNASNKDKDLNKHDLALVAHEYASRFYSGLTRYGDGMMGTRSPIPDYHNDKEFYDKMGNMATKRANDKSKECGVSTDTESK